MSQRARKRRKAATVRSRPIPIRPDLELLLQGLGLAALVWIALAVSVRNTHIIVIKEPLWHALMFGAFGLMVARRAAGSPAAIALPRVVWGALALYGGVYLLSLVFNTTYWGPLLKHTLNTACGLATFLVYARLARSRGFLRRAAWALAGTVAILGTYAVLQQLRIDPLPVRQEFPWGVPLLKRITGTFGNPTYFAGYLVVVLPIVLCAAAAHTRTAARRALAAAWLLGALGLVLTFSRGGALGALAGHAVVLTLLSHWWRADAPGPSALWNIWPRVWIATGGLACVVLIAGMALYGGVVFGVLGRLMDASAQGRAYMYQGTLNMIADRPLLGFGPGTFAVHFPDYWIPELSQVEPRHAKRVTNAHSEPLQIAAETGLLGLASYLALVGVVLVAGARSLRTGPTGFDWWLRVGLIAGLCGCLLDGAFSVGQRYAGSMAIFWTVLGLLAGLLPVTRKTVAFPRGIRIATATAAGVAAVVLITISLSWFMADRWLYRSQAALLRKDPRATAYAERALQFDPWCTQARYQLATEHFVAGRYDECISLCDTILAHERYFADVATLLGSACLKAGRPERAVEMFERTVRDEPDYQRGHHFLGVGYLELARTAPTGEQQRPLLQKAYDALDSAARLAEDDTQRAALRQRATQTKQLLEQLAPQEP